MSDADPQPDLDLVAASLRADLADMGSFAEALAVKLEAAVPAATRVRRGGLRGRGPVQAIAVDADGERLELRVHRGAVQATWARVSGGIVLKTEEVDVGEWIEHLTVALAAQARRSESTRQALERLLNG